MAIEAMVTTTLRSMSDTGDRFLIVWLGCVQITKWLIVGGSIFAVFRWGLPPLAQEIVGEDTNFKVDVGIQVSVVVNVALALTGTALWRSNKELRRRVRELERGRTSTTPQTLPIREGRS